MGIDKNRLGDSKGYVHYLILWMLRNVMLELYLLIITFTTSPCNEHRGKPHHIGKSGVCRGTHYLHYFGSKT